MNLIPRGHGKGKVSHHDKKLVPLILTKQQRLGILKNSFKFLSRLRMIFLPVPEITKRPFHTISADETIIAKFKN